LQYITGTITFYTDKPKGCRPEGACIYSGKAKVPVEYIYHYMPVQADSLHWITSHPRQHEVTGSILYIYVCVCVCVCVCTALVNSIMGQQQEWLNYVY